MNLAVLTLMAAIIVINPPRPPAQSGGGGGGAEETFVTNVTGGSNGAVPTAGAYRGYKFTVGGANITVTQLAAYFVSGTYADVTVKLKNASCTELASVVVPIAGSTVNAFNWATLGTPVTLQAGQTYHLMQSVEGYNEFLLSPTYTTTAAASITDFSDETCSNVQAYNAAVNFKYTTP
jgi:hypothetical protein